VNSEELEADGECPNCGANRYHSDVISDYLFNVEWDRHVLPCKEILQCSDCSVMYAWPMPSEASLEAYYTEIYRAPGRPHHFSGQPQILVRHLAYLSYISTFVPLPELKRVYEIGAGFGEMGLLLKTVNPKIELVTHEPDSYARGHLEDVGYTVLPNASATEQGVDLVLSIHSMEHFANLQDFFSLSSCLRNGGYLFVEVPNCSVTDGWLSRPYDSPHLLFFDSATFQKSIETRQFKTVAISKSGISLSDNFSLGFELKRQLGEWRPESNDGRRPRPSSARELARQLLPTRATEIIQAALGSAQTRPLLAGASDINNSATEGWLLRGLFQKLEGDA